VICSKNGIVGQEHIKKTYKSTARGLARNEGVWIHRLCGCENYVGE